MSTRRHKDPDLQGLNPEEAVELGELVDELEAGRFEPDQPGYWDALHQRIMNEVAVTPLPRARTRADRASTRGWWARALAWLRNDWRSRAVRVGLVTAAVVILGLVVLTKDHPQDPVRHARSPENLLGRTDSPGLLPATTTGDLQIPEELWSDGLLVHQPPDTEAADQMDWAAADGDAEDSDWLATAPFELSNDPLNDALPTISSNPSASWGLNALSDDELAELDSLLGS